MRWAAPSDQARLRPRSSRSRGLQLAVPAAAGAQSAWLPLKGEASVSLTFQSLDYRGHFVEDGTKQEGLLPSRAQLGIMELEYALTDRLALNASLPYIASSTPVPWTIQSIVDIHDLYDQDPADQPGAPPSLDTGNYNATFQDFVFLVRYNLLERWLTVTPVIGATVPSHDYRTTGEAAPGLNRLALHTGVNVGRLLDPLAPNAYVHAHFSYSFVRAFSRHSPRSQRCGARGRVRDRTDGDGSCPRQLAEDARRYRVRGGATRSCAVPGARSRCSPAAIGASPAARP